MHEPKETERNIPIKILLVEDQALTRMGIKTALNRTRDLKVIGEVGNGEEAVVAAQDLHPDLILMDVGMPVLDGIQAAKRIVEAQPEIKIIMLTQHNSDCDILASLAAGASGYCLKTVEPESLYIAIRSVHAGDAWLDPIIAACLMKHLGLQLELNATESPLRTAPHEAALKLSQSKDLNLIDHTERPSLSTRETEVLKLVVGGFSNQQIADQLKITLATAKSHVRSILNKLAVDDRTQAAVHAMRLGLVV